MARAALVVTGTEVLEGRVRDENGAMVAASLTAHGVTVERITVVGDALADITTAVEEAMHSGVELVVTTGGLGPTHDDRTMDAVAAATGRTMELDEGALELVHAALAAVPARASREVREAGARKQATIPAGATVLPPAGTAPGAVVDAGRCLVVVLPGPPWECAAGWHEALRVERVARTVGASAGAAPLELRMAGIVESEFMDALRVLDPDDLGLTVGVCARPGELEVTVRPPGAAAEGFVAGLEQAFPGSIFSRDGARVEEVVARLLLLRGQVLGTAESCTGGMIGSRLTTVTGASAWYAGGVVSYSNEVKESALGVPAHLLRDHGAVSDAVAGAMATGARERLGCDWAIAVTGIAGPDGGTPDKPVGLVYIGIAGPDGVGVRELRLHGDRERIRQRSSTIALHLLREALAD
jgi:nicotinamide-nucleotide amidase